MQRCLTAITKLSCERCPEDLVGGTVSRLGAGAVALPCPASSTHSGTKPLFEPIAKAVMKTNEMFHMGRSKCARHPRVMARSLGVLDEGGRWGLKMPMLEFCIFFFPLETPFWPHFKR